MNETGFKQNIQVSHSPLVGGVNMDQQNSDITKGQHFVHKVEWMNELCAPNGKTASSLAACLLYIQHLTAISICQTPVPTVNPL